MQYTTVLSPHCPPRSKTLFLQQEGAESMWQQWANTLRFRFEYILKAEVDIDYIKPKDL